MTNDVLKAICDAIKKGVLAKDSPLSVHEFTAIREATVIINRKWAIELVATVREDFKQQVEALAAKV